MLTREEAKRIADKNEEYTLERILQEVRNHAECGYSFVVYKMHPSINDRRLVVIKNKLKDLKYEVKERPEGLYVGWE
jgi:hypothetical protein